MDIYLKHYSMNKQDYCEARVHWDYLLQHYDAWLNYSGDFLSFFPGFLDVLIFLQEKHLFERQFLYLKFFYIRKQVCCFVNSYKRGR